MEYFSIRTVQERMSRGAAATGGTTACGGAAGATAAGGGAVSAATKTLLSLRYAIEGISDN